MTELSRRLFVAGAACAMSTAAAGQEANTRPWQPRSYDDGLIPAFSFEAISLDVGGALGVYALDTETGRASGWDANGLYPLNSTFNFLVAGLVLRRVDRGQEAVTRQIDVLQSDIVPHSPVVEKAVGSSMDVAALCAATVTQGDNAAANLLVRSLGGPAEMTASLREIGDPVTRIDQYEPLLNDVPLGDPRNSSTPAQMVQTMARLVLGDVLSDAGKARLLAWLTSNTTGNARVRAGVPADWLVGCQTGTGLRGETSTVAVIYPLGRKPLLMAVYIKGSMRSDDAQDSIHAELARIATTNVLLPPYDPYADE